MTIGSLITQTVFEPPWSPSQLPSLVDKVAIVTGASTGLGKVTAKELARKGAHVFLVGRSPEKTAKAIEEIKKETGSTKVDFIHADFLDLHSVESAADTFLRHGLPLHILVNNAGVMRSPFELSKQKIESQFAVNHFAHVVFTIRLMPALKRAPVARIVNVSSLAHVGVPSEGIAYDRLNTQEKYDTGLRYSETKLANLHFTRELQRFLEFKGINNILVNAVHPGVVATELSRHDDPKASLSLRRLFFNAIRIDAYKGALTQIYVAADPDIERLRYRGQYFVPYAALADPAATATDPILTFKTFDWTEKVLQSHFRKSWAWDSI
eukprot:jgi/Hompol1/6321/HPOL_001080-RA